jgi:hypothetical protein
MKHVQRICVGASVVSGMIFPSNCTIHGERHFRGILMSEFKKARQCDAPVLLMLIDVSGLLERASEFEKDLVSALDAVTREKDTKGWFESNTIIGIIFRNLDQMHADVVMNRVIAAVGRMRAPGKRSVASSAHIILAGDNKNQEGLKSLREIGSCTVNTAPTAEFRLKIERFFEPGAEPIGL